MSALLIQLPPQMNAGRPAVFNPSGPVIVATAHMGLQTSLSLHGGQNLLVFNTYSDVLDAMAQAGCSALFLDFLALADDKTGMRVLRDLSQAKDLTDLPVWLMADSWPPAQDVWIRSSFGARGYCLRSEAAIRTKLAAVAPSSTAPMAAATKSPERSSRHGPGEMSGLEQIQSALILTIGALGARVTLEAAISDLHARSENGVKALVAEIARRIDNEGRRSDFMRAAAASLSHLS